MVEGISARELFHTERMNNLIEPGVILLLTGLLMPFLVEELNDLTGRFTIGELNLFNGFFSVLMAIGLVLIAYGITYRRKGHVLLPLVSCMILLCSLDLFVWVYYVWLNWTPGPSEIFIVPFASPGQIPFLLTLLFIIMVIIARLSYFRDPRKSGKPKYFR